MKKKNIIALKRVKYEIDPHNRLILTKAEIPKFRTVYDGTFQTDKNNRLTYHVKKTDSKKTPQQIKLSGIWHLDKNLNLSFMLDKWNQNCFQNKLTFKSTLRSATSNQLIFTLTTKDNKDNRRDYLLKLNGAWQADRNNQLSFKIENENVSQKNLTLSGAWNINNIHQIAYSYTSRNKKHTLAFKGHWDIGEKNRISYILEKKIGSEFDFKISYCRITPKGLTFEITFNENNEKIKKSMCLQGEWDINKKIGILFKVRPGEKNNIAFGGFLKFDNDSQVKVLLQNEAGKPLGFETTISKAFPKKQGEVFLKMLAQKKSATLTLGAGFKW